MKLSLAVGSMVVARYPRRFRMATSVRSVIDIPAGACLEIVRLDERWDNTHAMIARTYKISLDLRVCTGPSAGEIVTLNIAGSVVTDLGQEAPANLPIPEWLELAPTPVVC
jgi:hypothetical protein